MKYITYPIICLIWWLIFTSIYCIQQLLYFCWVLKFSSNINILSGNQYYYCSHRAYKCCNYFYKDTVAIYPIKPNNPITHLKWIIKYGMIGEITEISDKEFEAYTKWLEENENTEKIS